MAGFYEIISRKILPYYNFIVVIFLFVIFSVAGYYIYTNFNSKKTNTTDSILNSNNDGGGSGGGGEEENTKPKTFWDSLTSLWGGNQKYTNPNKNNQVVKPGSTITVHFFTADWCPHCRKAKPAIDDFEKDYSGKKINGRTIVINRVDCTDSELEDVSKQINQFNVTSFPTVKIKDSNGNVFDFDGKITHENLSEFVNSVANN